MTVTGTSNGHARKAIYVSFSAEINDRTSESLIAVMANCVKQGATEVYLLFSTPGGNISSGIKLYNTLRAFPFRLTIHNVGDVDSIGSVVFLAGRQRYACADSRFIYHGFARGFNPPADDLTAEQLRNALESLRTDEQRVSSIIEKHSSLGEEDITSFFRDRHSMDATEALNAGIIQEIKDVEMPVGSPIVVLELERYPRPWRSFPPTVPTFQSVMQFLQRRVHIKWPRRQSLIRCLFVPFMLIRQEPDTLATAEVLQK